MASLNKVMLIGNLARDPEIRHMPNGDAVANFSIATSENWKDKNGQKQERTEWHNIVLYRRQAEVAAEWLKKGSSVYIEGRLQTRKWQDKQSGQDRYTTEIIGDQMQMLGGRGATQNDYQSQPQASGPPSQPRTPAARPATQRPQVDDFADDDIPF